MKTIETKAFRAFIGIYSLFKSEWTGTNIKLTLHKAQSLSHLWICDKFPSLEIAAPAK
jgi:hypothetical protein